MTATTSELTVAQMVTERPSRARVFHRYGIEFCCGGKISLDEACRQREVDPDRVRQALAEAEAEPNQEPNWAEADLADLAQHIVATHHAYLREDLPRLGQLMDKVTRKYGPYHAWIPPMHQVFGHLRAALERHLIQEERDVFPLCAAADSAAEIAVHPAVLATLEDDHRDTAQALATLRTLSNDFTPPADACNGFRALLDGLAEMEADVHRHVHKENHILFPRLRERLSA